jgi:hypothetical protein
LGAFPLSDPVAQPAAANGWSASVRRCMSAGGDCYAVFGLQDAGRYPLLVMRNALVPLASVGSSLSWIIIIAGFLLHLTNLVLLGIVAFSLVVVFQLVNLPVEFDASRRARIALVDGGLVTPEEDVVVGRVLHRRRPVPCSAQSMGPSGGRL